MKTATDILIFISTEPAHQWFMYFAGMITGALVTAALRRKMP